MYTNDIDSLVDEQIFRCLDLQSPKSFFLFAGAGSGKTRSLVNVLEIFEKEFGQSLRLTRRKVAVITYTNAASEEIIHRLKANPIFWVSTIHSFSWQLIQNFTKDIKEWLEQNLQNDIVKLEAEQARSRNPNNKTSILRAKQIESKKRRLLYLPNISSFTYNPNGDNTSKESLNHSEVISITAHLIQNKALMQDITISRFPIILVDESQDTKKELIEALFQLQEANKNRFTLGLFGDTMQRIYMDGKENLGNQLPNDWVLPEKKMNHRSSKRIIALVNDIRKSVDKKEQYPRTEKSEGVVRLFIVDRGISKIQAENNASREMIRITNDELWDLSSSGVKTLILEHHMAAQRLGFFDFFEPLYHNDKTSTGLLDGSLAPANFFIKIIIPLKNAFDQSDRFAQMRIVKEYSKLLAREELVKIKEQEKNLLKANEAIISLLTLWNDENDPTLISILENIYASNLFPIPEVIYPLVEKHKYREKIGAIDINDSNEEEEQSSTDTLLAWQQALTCPYSQVVKYSQYLAEDSKFGTHQGVKGLEFPRVMVVIDDEEARGFIFSYDKLFGTKDPTSTDKKNEEEGKDTAVDRTKRLFYVACSRACDSLAIVAYTNLPENLKRNVIQYQWFTEDEVLILK
ncbi:UvrD-helicase domain-containing protein [Chitinophaga rhizophila]|uniref:AAA family ATPase n=1 Tax=Chitinophaga rhizophila TaxID=2866212 RepID=A0ABS7GC05_9BACT|nr:UvrD-helicase domain-containing protein [Chitinophaga rhizophila]MBW8685208.1 AAA family ATPase [Chitinophaga rhizophila]